MVLVVMIAMFVTIMIADCTSFTTSMLFLKIYTELNNNNSIQFNGFNPQPVVNF